MDHATTQICSRFTNRTHGLKSTYAHGCRCDPCRAAYRTWYASNRTSERPYRRNDGRSKVPGHPRYRAPERVAVCDVCGSWFSTRRSRQRFCSRRCQDRHWMAQPQRRRVKNPKPCDRCGALWHPFKGTKACQTCEACRPPLPKTVKVKATRIYIKDCRICGTTFVTTQPNGTYCSVGCREVNNRRRSSDKLMGLYRAAIEARQLRSAKSWHRQLCEYLAERDGSACGICGREVDIRAVSGTRHGRKGDAGPSVDHLVPSSHGGTDDLANLRLVHWRCNRFRGNRGGDEQLRLIG